MTVIAFPQHASKAPQISSPAFVRQTQETAQLPKNTGSLVGFIVKLIKGILMFLGICVVVGFAVGG